jgi:SAM-dependent methyltransferase
MRSYWDERARENAMFFIHSALDYRDPSEQEFWTSGEHSLVRTLQPFGLAVRPTDDVVEIGCGIGRMTRPLAARARRVVGVDVSPEMIERGRRALGDLPNVELVVGNGQDLGILRDGSADVVYSFIVFQHIPEPTVTCGYVREIGRVLRPGGWTLFQVSELSEVHRADAHRRDRGPRAGLRRALGHEPRGCVSPEWLGSAVPREDLLRALSDGGLVLDDSVGDGTQYCLVCARKPGGAPAA